MAKTKRRKVRSKDWHAWAWKAGKTWPHPGELFYWAESDRPPHGSPESKPTDSGKWVKVKFLEVKP